MQTFHANKQYVEVEIVDGIVSVKTEKVTVSIAAPNDTLIDAIAYTSCMAVLALSRIMGYMTHAEHSDLGRMIESAYHLVIKDLK